MLVPPIAGSLAAWSALSRTLTGVAGLVSGFVVLGFVVQGAGPATGVVVIHVTERDVDISVGGVTRHVEESLGVPLILELPRGRQTLVMSRRGVVLQREDFVVKGDDSVVVTAWVARAP